MCHQRHPLHSDCLPPRIDIVSREYQRRAQRQLWGWVGEKLAGPKGRRTAECIVDAIHATGGGIVH